MILLSMAAIFTAARFKERQRVLENAHAYFSAEAETLGIVASRYYNIDNEERGHTRVQPEPLPRGSYKICAAQTVCFPGMSRVTRGKIPPNVHLLLNGNILI